MVNAIDILSARDAAATGRARRIRHAAGLSQSDVARHIGTDASTVSRWENGVLQPNGAAAERLAVLLRQLASYLAEGETPSSPEQAKEVSRS
jgi:transcriptional regulator with XRE-family HTH domain